jgi:hypothetical protein
MFTDAQIAEAKSRHTPFSILENAGKRVVIRRDGEGYVLDGCPICGTTHPGQSDRFRVWTDGTWCRQCDKKLDAIDLYKTLHNTTFEAAVREMLNMPAATTTPTTATTFARPKESKPFDQHEAYRDVSIAHDVLSNHVNPGLAFLTRRGITPHTMRTYMLGYKTNCNGREGITIPWYAADAKINGVKYRHLKGEPRYTAQEGSDFHTGLFGLQAANALNKFLVLVEGEINAMSIHQVAHEWADVFSFGGEGSKLTDASIEFINTYPVRIVWADKPGKAQTFAKNIGASFYASERNGIKKDANDLLQEGTLQRMVAALCLLDKREPEQLRSDLARATLDELTSEMCEKQGLWSQKER